MPEDFIKFAFAAGVLSRSLLHRSDLEKFDLGLQQGTNWFIDYRGGASTRAGTEFVDYIQDDDEPARFIPFRFNTSLANLYQILFHKNKIRFVQDGAYITESAQSLDSMTLAAPAVFTITGHGFSVDDLVKVAGVDDMTFGTYIVNTVPTADTFTLKDPFDNVVDSATFAAYVSGGTVARVYTIASPYATADLQKLSYDQYLNSIIITAEGYARRELVRNDTTDWELNVLTPGADISAPSSITLTPSSAGTAGVLYIVTSVDANGNESRVGSYGLTELSVDFSATAGSMRVEWPAVSGASYYKVYRSLVLPVGAEITLAQSVGFLGFAYGPYFVDRNVVPDFTRTPPEYRDPFANGAIQSISITAGGSGYGKTTATVSVSGGGGSGFIGKPIVDDGGAIIGVIILDPGSGYSSPSVSFGGGGSGATATAVAGASSGNNPRTTARLQQRRLYLGTTNAPMTIEGTKPGLYNNFDISLGATDGDAYSLALDSPELTPIKHAMPLISGLLIFTESSIWYLRGADDNIITGNTAIADLKEEIGIADVQPIRIEAGAIYVQRGGGAVRSAREGQLRGSYQAEELSLYSADFFVESNKIVSWTYAADPYRLVWGVREDGTAVSMTYVPSQNVYAWTDHNTQGLFEDVSSIIENGTDIAYWIVRRKVNGVWKRYMERSTPRAMRNIENMFAVDSGLQTTDTFPAAEISFSAASGTATITASASVFASGDVGKHLRAAGGRALVTAYTSGTSIDVLWEIEPTDIITQTSEVRPQASGDWTLNAKSATFSGLNHLEGLTVQVLADGNVKSDAVVTNGAITLAAAASKVIVGLGFSGPLKTLPLLSSNAIIENKKKRVTGVALRLLDARGLWVGDGVDMYEMKDRTDEDWGDPTRFQTGIRSVSINSTWDDDGAFQVEKRGPLQATILGYVVESEVSDD